MICDINRLRVGHLQLTRIHDSIKYTIQPERPWHYVSVVLDRLLLARDVNAIWICQKKKGNGQAIASMYYIKEYEVLVSDACERKLFMKIIDYLEFNAGISIPTIRTFEQRTMDIVIRKSQ